MSPHDSSQENRLEGLSSSFFQRDVLKVAPDLLGSILEVKNNSLTLAARIVEVEAYRGPEDQAAHSSGARRTPRNQVMWGPAGRLYVYFVYGMHWCTNVVCAGDGQPQAVLLRGAVPIQGEKEIRRRRRRDLDLEVLLRGPACLSKGLGIDGGDNGAVLGRGRFRLRAGILAPEEVVKQSPRIGVDYAGEDAQLPWRYYIAGSPGVSGPARLRR
ncbi:MAG: DNA-3-methyladenine glycosylase [Planctomycetota bacterium]|nr:MAG: DNA-3-methyladenine glycosylase [Planctomycetota bacterium]